MSEIIPFGEYKGQPIEILASDPKYADWLRHRTLFELRGHRARCGRVRPV
jgi:hypothetical protein